MYTDSRGRVHINGDVIFFFTHYRLKQKGPKGPFVLQKNKKDISYLQ